jgi:hypothetical protein
LIVVGSFYKRGDFAWVQDVRANYLCIHKGELRATVLSTEWQPWHVILHFPGTPEFPETRAAFLAGERFADPFAAMSCAEEIINGAAPEWGRLVGLPFSWQPAR